MAKEILCAYGVDVDAVAGWLGSYGGEESPCDISRGMFAGEVGSPRLLRLFASRDHEDGECQVDCRVNGEDWPQGLDGLRAYAAAWPTAPGQTIEFRKQYVIVQDAPAAD